MAITKTKTNELKHMSASLVRGVENDPNSDEPPYISFSITSGGNTSETVMHMTKESYARAKKGAGCRSKELRNGLCGSSRFEFEVLYRDADKEAGETRPVVLGIHCIPTSNYLDADFASELRMPELERDNAVIDVHPTTGEIDIVAFPPRFANTMYRFLQHLEKQDTIDEFTSFKIGDIGFDVQDATGNRIVFMCRNMNPEASLRH